VKEKTAQELVFLLPAKYFVTDPLTIVVDVSGK